MISNLEVILQSKEATQEEKEQALINMLLENLEDIQSFIKRLPALWPLLTIARMTKILKVFLGNLPCVKETIKVYDDLILYYFDKKMLCLELKSRRITLLLKLKEYSECLTSITLMLRDLKKYDDKVNQVSLLVCESIAYYETRNSSRARSSLTSARAISVSTFCPCELQARIDKQTGIYMCEEGNYNTAYSYFLESLDSFILDKMGEEVIIILRYILLSKILLKAYDEIENIVIRIQEKIRKLKENVFKDEIIQILFQISKCCKERDLLKYNFILNQNNIFENDIFMISQLKMLYEKLLEDNIIKIIEPYNNIKIKFISDELNLDIIFIETKIRKMILDKKIKAIIDHVTGILIVYNPCYHKEEKKFEIVNDLIDYINK